MIRRILFVYLDQQTSSYTVLRGRPDRSVRRRPQLGFQYLSAVLDRIGVDSVILDQSITFFTAQDLAGKVRETSADIVGFYSASALKEEVKSCIFELKKRISVPIIVGGPGSFNAQEYLEVGCDLVCHGEGEKTIIDIVDYYNGKKNKQQIKGISYMDSGTFVKNEPQELIVDLDSLPFPKRDKISIDYYQDYYIFTAKKPYATMMASRGCPMNCTFCSSHCFWGGKYRVRSTENVLKEIDYLKDTFDIKYIAFLDDIFGLDEVWLESFCRGLLQRKYNIGWMTIVHPFSFRKSREKSLDLLKKAGCDMLSFGLQSADSEILKNIKRHPEESAELEKTIKMAKKKGFLTSISFIFGLPGETPETIKHSIDYCCKLRPTYAEFYNLEILEGSEMEQVYNIKENVCEISKEELDKWCKRAARKFYAHPCQIYDIFKIIITKNPSWLWIAVKNAKHFLRAVGC